LLLKAESDQKFYRKLQDQCASLAKLVQPRREIEAWRRLLQEIKPAKRVMN
jgi:hypothetical protein